MKKSIISGACAAALLAGLVFAAGCGRTSGADTEGKKPQTEETAAREEAAGETAEEMEDQAQDGTVEETQYPLTVTDDLGNEVVIEAEPERIVSLSPANTETLFALGAGEQLVGRTDYCSYPQEAAEVPSVGSYSSPNTELIISMDADVIFASDYMDAAIRSQVENDLESVEADILLAGRVLNRNEEAKEITDGMEAEMAELEEILSANTVEKSAFVDLGDYYSAGEGSLLGSMLEDIGVRNIAAATGEAWPQLSVETIIEANPDVYISLYTTPEELKQVPGLSSLDCIKNDQIIYYDGLSPEADLIQRAGPRLAEGTRLLAERIYPELFS